MTKTLFKYAKDQTKAMDTIVCPPHEFRPG